MMSNKEKAILILEQTREQPKMYANIREALLSRVVAILEMADIDFDPGAFYASHSEMYGNVILKLDREVEDAWAQEVIDDAISLLNDVKSLYN